MEVNLLEMTTIHDCSMNSVHANEGYRHCLRQQFDLNSITYYLVHTLLVDLVHWVLGHQQVKSVCNPCKMELKSRITIHEA